MKIIRLLWVAAAALFYCSDAMAQTSGTVTNHAFAIGKGAGQTGFTSLLCAATQLAVGQTSANPACKALSGDITMDADGVTAIGANKVTDGMLRQSGALSLIGRSANSTGNVADISAVSGSGCAYREASNVIGCGELATAALGANIVTNAKLAQMANGTTKCRTTAGTGNTEDCTASQMRSLLSLVVGTNVQAWDADLDAIAALTGTGIVRRTGSATFTTGTAVSNSELATMTNNTFKGNVSGGSAVPSDLTATQVLDAVGSTRGSILYRGASGWAILPPGTSGQVVTSNGAGADPSYQDAAGGSGGSDTDRRNALLNLIYQSKLFASYRRVINTFAAGFKSSDGVNAGSSSNYTVDTTNGLVKPTTAAGSDVSPTMTSNTAPSPYVISASSEDVSGNLGPAWRASDNSVASGFGWRATTGAGSWWKIDFGSSTSVGSYTITSRTDTAANQPTAWTLQGSATGSFSGEQTTVDTQSGITWSGGAGEAKTFTLSGSANYRYYRLAFSAVNGGGAIVLSEIRFFGPTTFNNMTVVTTAQTADASVSNARVLLEFDNTATPTLDTDLTVEVTCNGGTNWASASLSAVTSNSQGGRKVAETADTACTAGTSFAARIKTLNKNVPIYGASVVVH